MQFKIIRDSEIEIDDEAADLVRYFEKAIKKRRRGNVVKLEVLTNSNKKLLNFLKVAVYNQSYIILRLPRQ